MKLLLLLIAIYSLIFYQHYKIEKSRTLPLPAAQPKAEKSSGEQSVRQQQDYGSANFIMKTHNSIVPEHPIARLGFDE